MIKKHGSYFADWRDAQGKRHRKAFRTRKAAAQFTESQRRERDAAKKARPRKHSAR
ncbi:MAG TPA: hypothetical protein VJN42_07420 [Candidatus Acidoferrum sp.]|nr:hypothetical protein [Candidatus Acidoferrum sp.]